MANGIGELFDVNPQAVPETSHEANPNGTSDFVSPSRECGVGLIGELVSRARATEAMEAAEHSATLELRGNVEAEAWPEPQMIRHRKFGRTKPYRTPTRQFSNYLEFRKVQSHNHVAQRRTPGSAIRLVKRHLLNSPFRNN